MNRQKRVVFLDLWKTLVTSHCAEPVWSLQKALGHKLWTPTEGGPEVFEPDDEFLRFCLTTPILDPDEFVREAAKRFGCSVSARTLMEFEKILKGESGCVARFEDVNETLEGLRDRGYTLGVISNLWPFPAERIFDINGLGKYFPRENRVYSYEVKHRKPEREIYLAACRQLDVAPEHALMIGDNLEADVVGPKLVGMDSALIDRPGVFTPNALPEGALHLRSLPEILPILDEAS